MATRRYDAAENFEEEEAAVRFLSGRHLRHAEDDAMLLWRREGDAAVSVGGEGEDVIGIGEISAAYEDLER